MKQVKTEFGILEFDDNAVIHFESGIYGFEGVQDYVLINHDEQGEIMTLQSADSQVPQFIVLDPTILLASYNPIVSQADKALIDLRDDCDARYLVIAVVTENYLDTVVNLKSPIVINSKNNKACQAILENNDYSMKHKIFNNVGGN